ncbi:MAG: helix-turn-helix transcriptional regulator [Bacteroidetes bacterium]|nr:helix-turn-helix transcriptional regulator [Bacteroidota bacterium]
MRLDSYETIGDRLRFAREMAGLSPVQVARLLGCGTPKISNIEAGIIDLSEDEIVRFGDLYGVSTSWIIGKKINAPTEDNHVKLAARELSKLREEDLSRLLQFINAL